MATRDRDHEAAAAFVADALARLDDSWVVLLAPRLGLEQPDAIALHEQHGVCVITATGLRPGQPERHPDGYLVRPETPLRLAEQPHDVAERLGRHVYDGYYAGLEDPPRPTSAVRSIVVAPNFDDHTARELFRARGAADVEAAATVWGAGFARDLDAAVSATASSDAVTIAPSGLRRVLAGALTAPTGGGAMRPAAIRDESQPLVADPAGARFRRVRGVGGTGKTFALTARAAELARQGRDVLVLSFTTTLADRLVDLVRDRCTERGADARHVTVTNFHALSEHTVVSAESIGFTSTWPEGSRWPIAIVDRARQVIEQGFDFRYHAILVDEGQDFSLEWWEMLRDNFLADGGEMLVTADETQDLYRVEPWFDDETMTSLGFADPWIELTGTVRTPSDLVPALEVIGERDEAVPGSPERDRLIGPDVASVRRWVDIDRVADLGREIGREVVRLVRDHPTITPGDIVFLCDYHHDGLAAVREIERAGVPVHHQFSRDPAGRGIRRRRFDVGSSAVKGATVHGFKGWEVGALVMGIGADATSPALARIAIERVGTPASGGSSIVTVVNGDRSLREAGAALRWIDGPTEAIVPAELDSVAPADNTLTAPPPVASPAPPTRSDELPAASSAPSTPAGLLPPLVAAAPSSEAAPAETTTAADAFGADPFAPPTPAADPVGAESLAPPTPTPDPVGPDPVEPDPFAAPSAPSTTFAPPSAAADSARPHDVGITAASGPLPSPTPPAPLPGPGRQGTVTAPTPAPSGVGSGVLPAPAAAPTSATFSPPHTGSAPRSGAGSDEHERSAAFAPPMAPPS